MHYTPATFVLALLVTVVLTKLAIHWSPRWNLIDKPNARKVHQGAVPIGGFALVAGILLAGVIFGVISTPVMIGGGLIFVLGLIDDFRGLDPGIKLGGQFVAILPLLLTGNFLNLTWPPLSQVPFGSLITGALALLWIVGNTNAVNLVDGLDGLATGISVIIFAGLTIISPEPGWVKLAGAFLGGFVGFLYFNSYPAKVFLGDGGSYFLGYTIGYYSLYRTTAPPGATEKSWVMLCAVLIVGLPIIDTLWAIIRRIYTHRGIMQSDQGHLHHKMLQRVGHRRAVFSLYGIQVLLTSGGVLYWLYLAN